MLLSRPTAASSAAMIAHATRETGPVVEPSSIERVNVLVQYGKQPSEVGIQQFSREGLM
ncbi:MAG: hypothetical protein WCJ35_25750 [Planctomycetota bacterium]